MMFLPATKLNRGEAAVGKRKRRVRNTLARRSWKSAGEWLGRPLINSWLSRVSGVGFLDQKIHPAPRTRRAFSGAKNACRSRDDHFAEPKLRVAGAAAIFRSAKWVSRAREPFFGAKSPRRGRDARFWEQKTPVAAATAIFWSQKRVSPTFLPV
jgi:hypothetical protein